MCARSFASPAALPFWLRQVVEQNLRRRIVDACREEPIPIGGVMGEWRLAEAIWSILQGAPGFREVLASKEILQALDLRHVTRRNPH